jgi:hypothetical protein
LPFNPIYEHKRQPGTRGRAEVHPRTGLVLVLGGSRKAADHGLPHVTRTAPEKGSEIPDAGPKLSYSRSMARGRRRGNPTGGEGSRIVFVEYHVPVQVEVDSTRQVVTAVKVIDEEVSVPDGVLNREGAEVSSAEAEQARKIAEDSSWPPWTFGS